MVGGRRGHSGKNVVPQIDLSLLRQAIDLGSSGAEQIGKCLESGTTEVQQLLLYECDIIFECKVCRSLFRGLANLLAHKRAYCTTSYVSTQLQLAATVNDAHTTVVVQPEAPEASSCATGEIQDRREGDGLTEGNPEFRTELEPDSCDKEHVDGIKIEKTGIMNPTADHTLTKSKRCDVENQLKDGTLDAKSNEYKFYTQVDEKVQKRKAERNECVVVLQNIESNPCAVYQVVSRSGPDTPAKDKPKVKEEDKHEEELLEEGQIEEEGMQGVVTVMPEEPKGPVHMTLRQRSLDGDVATPIALRLSNRPDCDVKLKTCLKCNTTYTSLKTLHFHMTSLHSEKKIFYPCLYCDSEFSQLWVATRHVMRTHRKSREHMETIRETIKNRSYSKVIEEVANNNNNLQRTANTEALPSKRTRKDGVPEPDSSSNSSIHGKSARLKKLKSREVEKTNSNSTGNIDLRLFTCSSCGKVFGKKESLIRHSSFCVETKPCDTLSNSSRDSGSRSLGSRSKRTNSMDSEISEVDNKDSNSGDPGRWSKDISAEDLLRINNLIDKNQLQCLKCKTMYASISNLHRHAVRHLGWQRFKCQLCKFTSYNRSECKSHLRKVHPAKVQNMFNLTPFIVDLEPENTKAEVSLMSQVEPGRRYSGTDLLPEHPRKSIEQYSPGLETRHEKSDHVDSSTKTYNISTRRSPRVFDTKPYQREEHTLFKRSGLFPKLKLTVVKRNIMTHKEDLDEKEEEEDETLEEADTSGEHEDEDHEMAGDLEEEENEEENQEDEEENDNSLENKENDMEDNEEVNESFTSKEEQDDNGNNIDDKLILSARRTNENVSSPQIKMSDMMVSSSTPSMQTESHDLTSSSGIATDIHSSMEENSSTQHESKHEILLESVNKHDSSEQMGLVEKNKVYVTGVVSASKGEGGTEYDHLNADIMLDSKYNSEKEDKPSHAGDGAEIPEDGYSGDSSQQQLYPTARNFSPQTSLGMPVVSPGTTQATTYPNASIPSPNLKLPIYEDISDDEEADESGETVSAPAGKSGGMEDSSVALEYGNQGKNNSSMKPLLPMPSHSYTGGTTGSLAALPQYGVINYCNIGATPYQPLGEGSFYEMPVLQREEMGARGGVGQLPIPRDNLALPKLQQQQQQQQSYARRMDNSTGHISYSSSVTHPMSLQVAMGSQQHGRTVTHDNLVAMTTADELLDMVDRSQSNETLGFDCS